MANLKGATFIKQIRDANFRLAAFKSPRNGNNSHKTHSDATRIKRERYLKDFQKFAENNTLSGKLNELMNEAHLSEFFQERLQDLSLSSQEDYLRGFSGMLQGLEQTNITIKVDKEFFNTQVARYKENGLKAGMKLVTTSFTPSEVIQQLPYPSSLIAQLQYETGLRVSEAYAVLKNPEMHIDVNTLHSIQGKGGQIYTHKIISEKLQIEIEQFISQQKSLPNQSTYYRHLQKYDMRSHDFRAFYAKELYEELKENGVSDKEAYAQVSKEINHHRISITKYYLAKFEGN